MQYVNVSAGYAPLVTKEQLTLPSLDYFTHTLGQNAGTERVTDFDFAVLDRKVLHYVALSSLRNVMARKETENKTISINCR